jgi:small GTP-binding protein
VDKIMEYRKKILLLGDASVGKTSLIRRYVVDFFDDGYLTTIGTKVTSKNMQITVDKKAFYLKLQIWDVLGQKGYTKLYNASFKGAHGVFFIADITRKETLESIENYWIPQVKRINDSFPFVILANKSDLVKNAKFDLQDLEDFASKYKVPFYLTSAKDGENVNNAFNTLGDEIIRFKESSSPKLKDPLKIEEIKSKDTVLIDKIINDFCIEYGRLEDAMPILRRQFELAKLDLNHPKKEAMVSAVERLAEVEMGFKEMDNALANLKKRLKWIKET